MISFVDSWSDIAYSLHKTKLYECHNSLLLLSKFAGKSDNKRIKLVVDEIDSNNNVKKCGDTTPMEHCISFPQRLMQMLDSDEFSGIVFWSGYGNSFCINTREFIPGSKFESFIRKLNRWGFKRTYHQDFQRETIGYQHPMFHKGRPELLTNLSNGKKIENKILTSAIPQQGTFLQGDEAHSSSLGTTNTTIGSVAKTAIFSTPIPAAVRNMNALHGQQSQAYRPMLTESTNVHFRELLLQQLLQSPAAVQSRQHQLPKLLISQQQQQQRLLREYLARPTLAPPSALSLAHDLPTLCLLKSASRLRHLPHNLSTVANQSYEYLQLGSL